MSQTSQKVEGRPRDASISRALLRAAERRMESDGFAKLTVDGIVTEVGTTRQTFYRRYKNVAALALEVLLHRFGGQEAVDTGKIELDLLELQRSDVAMMTSPLIQKNLPGLFEDIRAVPEIRETYLETMIRPRRNNVSAVLDRARRRGKLVNADVDSEYICDLLFGPLLARVLLPTGLPLDDRLARQTVATVLCEIMRPEAG
ncbi:TetR/AcrR family transcriptional regulator [Brevibacterium picturae]|uniref:TetR/AcrR family transcriptional regulator n=1 Tax=Brevibacterium picturae TaxID=260553 RepID=A0ABP4LY69_9MICO